MKRIIVAALLSGSLALGWVSFGVGTAQAFNPQPDPPGKPSNSGLLGVNLGLIHGFNPQPDPPGLPGLALTVNGPAGLDIGVKVGFNPQPDPPGEPTTAP
jgi:hypothetical protein